MTHWQGLGLSRIDAERVADDLIERVDTLLTAGVGATLKQIAKGHQE